MSRISVRRVVVGARDLIAASFAAWGLVIGLASCGDVTVRPAEPTASKPAAASSRAFGRARLYYKGEKIELGFFSRLLLFVRSQRTGEIEKMDITDERGTFSWALDPGEYVIVAYFHLNQYGRLWLTFTVPGRGEAVYIGDLHIAFTAAHYRWAVRNAYAEAEKDFKEALRSEGLKPKVELMKAEASPGTFRHMKSICATDVWGLECDHSNAGVKPLSPEGDPLPHPRAESLAPRLAWSPVRREGLTYDVAVYESISAPTVGLKRMRGALVLYAEGLREASYQVPKPLEANKQYEWSVRLRSGDTVSTWSTTGYFVFFVVGWASGSGNWFGFTTPER
jgi:hypothetical protein